MSITINTSSYLNGILQYTRNAASEKKDGESEVGKTQQSTISASLDQVNMGEDGIAITEVSRQQGAEQSASQNKSASPRMDTVEISAEGRAASAKLQSQQTGTTSAEAYQSEEDEDDLSQYTDAELKQMYYRGEITRQEYEEETGEKLE